MSELTTGELIIEARACEEHFVLTGPPGDNRTQVMVASWQACAERLLPVIAAGDAIEEFGGHHCDCASLDEGTSFFCDCELRTLQDVRVEAKRRAGL